MGVLRLSKVLEIFAWMHCIAKNMMSSDAEFHQDSPKGKKVKFILASAVELSETADFVYNFV